MKPTYEELELQLEESRREFRSADASIHNLELKLTDMAVQLANAESKCRELAAENAAIKNSIPKLKDIDYGNDNMDDVSLAEDVGFNDAVMLMNRWIPDTPSTDAFLAEVRAQGVEMAACALDDVNQFNYANTLDDLAQKIRQEAAQ